MSMYDDPTAPHDTYYDDDEEDYDEPESRRGGLIPILAIIAGVLAILIGIAVVLYVLGFFGSPGQPAGVASQPPTERVEPTPPPTALAPQQASVESSQPSSVPQAAVSIAPPAQDLPPIRSTHGDWQLRCDTPAGAINEQCFLMQFVTAEDRENVGLMVLVLKTADGQARIMRVIAPLGVLLPAGLGLKIDEADLGRAAFVRCTPRGCVAEVILEETLLQQMEAGNLATFIIFQTPEEGVGIPIALSGFGAGYANLP